MHKRTALLGTLLFLTLLVNPAQAAEKCTIIYGGGEIECEATVSATAKPTATPRPGQTATTTSGQGTTKGGLAVQEPTNVKQTPATGPEILGLAALIPAAAAGFYLRKKS